MIIFIIIIIATIIIVAIIIIAIMVIVTIMMISRSSDPLEGLGGTSLPRRATARNQSPVVSWVKIFLEMTTKILRTTLMMMMLMLIMMTMMMVMVMTIKMT